MHAAAAHAAARARCVHTDLCSRSLPPPCCAADIIAGAICARDGNFINRLMDLHTGPLMLLGEGWWGRGS